MAALQVAIRAHVEVVGIIAAPAGVVPMDLVPGLATALAASCSRAGERHAWCVVRARRYVVTRNAADTASHESLSLVTVSVIA
jgi:hypothetical protein